MNKFPHAILSLLYRRLSYECHLPMVHASNDSTQMLRKVLTIDVGFEQIAHLKFGSDQASEVFRQLTDFSRSEYI